MKRRCYKCQTINTSLNSKNKFSASIWKGGRRKALLKNSILDKVHYLTGYNSDAKNAKRIHKYRKRTPHMRKSNNSERNLPKRKRKMHSLKKRRHSLRRKSISAVPVHPEM